MSNDEFEIWLNNQSWYQKIELSNGLETDGKVSVKKRLTHFKDLELSGKTFLDIGCNSGGYSLWAKKQGASKVVGIDIDSNRLNQAKRLAEFEELEIDFKNKSILNFDSSQKFDVVFCISVLTEITDFFGALNAIKQLTGQTAIIELALARPKLYLSTSRRWISGYDTVSRQKGVFELLEHKRGYMIAPSLEILKSFFGDDFTVNELGKGQRYDLVKVQKR